jgi:sec-independent protein translocase protein TatA
MLPNIGFSELIVILVLALIIFGPGKLPDVGKALGKSLGEFKKASRAIENEINTPSQTNNAVATEKPSAETKG